MAPRAAGPAGAGDRTAQAWLALSVAVGLMGAGFALSVGTGMAVIDQVGTLVIMAPFGLVGFVVARHQPRNPIGWMFIAIVAMFGVLSLADAYEVVVYRHGHHLPLATVSLAALYLGGVFVIDRALQAVTGQSSALAVTISTLAVAAAFQPLRTRIQRLVDRRFYRAKYDANRTLEAFSSCLRDQLDLNALHTEVLDVVHATLQPRTASLWLRPPVGRQPR